MGDTFFYEVRIHNPAATAYAEALADPLLARVKEIPRRMEDYVFSLNFSPYSRRMLAKFPGMVKFADNHVRVGTGDRQFVLRGYLPAVAAHNLVLGAHLCLLESPGAGMVATTTADLPRPPHRRSKACSICCAPRKWRCRSIATT